jgi:NIMA (never in mitosis gene a)-related kinase 1/4/5
MKSDIWSLGCVLYEAITLKPPFRADDMAGLYRKVLKGQYAAIPSHYSNDLANVVKSLLQVQANQRPSCDEILEIPGVKKMGERLFPDFYEDESPRNNQLLSTIRVPKNLLYLTDRLPKPSYNNDG